MFVFLFLFIFSSSIVPIHYTYYISLDAGFMFRPINVSVRCICQCGRYKRISLIWLLGPRKISIFHWFFDTNCSYVFVVDVVLGKQHAVYLFGWHSGSTANAFGSQLSADAQTPVTHFPLNGLSYLGRAQWNVWLAWRTFSFRHYSILYSISIVSSHKAMNYTHEIGICVHMQCFIYQFRVSILLLERPAVVFSSICGWYWLFFKKFFGCNRAHEFSGFH